MTTTLRRIAASVCLPLLASLPTMAELRTGGEPIALEMQYRPGTTYVQTMTMEQTTAMPMGGGEQTMEMTMSMQMPGDDEPVTIPMTQTVTVSLEVK